MHRKCVTLQRDWGYVCGYRTIRCCFEPGGLSQNCVKNRENDNQQWDLGDSLSQKHFSLIIYCWLLLYPLVNQQKTMEHHHVQWVNQLEMLIFNSFLYVYQAGSMSVTRGLLGFGSIWKPPRGAIFPRRSSGRSAFVHRVVASRKMLFGPVPQWDRFLPSGCVWKWWLIYG